MSMWHNNNRIHNDRCILAMFAAGMKPRTIQAALEEEGMMVSLAYIEAIVAPGQVESLSNGTFGWKAVEQNIAAHKAMKQICDASQQSDAPRPQGEAETKVKAGRTKGVKTGEV